MKETILIGEITTFDLICWLGGIISVFFLEWVKQKQAAEKKNKVFSFKVFYNKIDELLYGTLFIGFFLLIVAPYIYHLIPNYVSLPILDEYSPGVSYLVGVFGLKLFEKLIAKKDSINTENNG